MPIPSFPILPGMGFPITRAPSGSSVRQESISGRRTILPQRSVPRWTWGIPFEFLRSAKWGSGSFTELEALAGFYNAQLLSGLAFAFTDAEDNAAVSQPFGEGDGVTTDFQLVRAYGGFSEPVYSPTGTPTIDIAGTPTTDFTVGATGIVAFGTAPASGALLTWTGGFAWVCRFDEDSLDLSRFMVGLTEAKAVKFSNEIAL